MTTTTYTFREIKLRERVKVKCRNCGKMLPRIVEAFQTLNPYNVNAKGVPKSEQEIRAELPAKLKTEVDFYLKQRWTCRTCAKAGGGM